MDDDTIDDAALTALDYGLPLVLGAVPVAGSALVAAWQAGQRQADRQAMRAVELATLPHLDTWVETDPANAELFRRVIESARRAIDDEKVRALALVLKRAATDDAKVDDALLIVDGLADLDPAHVRALRLMTGPIPKREDNGIETGWTHSGAEMREAGYSEAAARRVLSDLEAGGFVHDATLGVFGGSSTQHYRLTDFGRMALEVLAAAGAGAE